MPTAAAAATARKCTAIHDDDARLHANAVWRKQWHAAYDDDANANARYECATTDDDAHADARHERATADDDAHAEHASHAARGRTAYDDDDDGSSKWADDDATNDDDAAGFECTATAAATITAPGR